MTVTVIFVAELPETVALGGTAQLVASNTGVSVQVKVTAWFRPPRPTKLKL